MRFSGIIVMTLLICLYCSGCIIAYLRYHRKDMIRKVSNTSTTPSSLNKSSSLIVPITEAIHRPGNNGKANKNDSFSERANKHSQIERKELHYSAKFRKQTRNNSSRARSRHQNPEASDFMVISTAAASKHMHSVEMMVSGISESSSHTRVIVFDLGLSEKDKEFFQRYPMFEIWRAPVNSVDCRDDVTAWCKSQMIYRLLSKYSVLVWADIGLLPLGNLRNLLDEYPVGTNFVGSFSSRALYDFADVPLLKTSTAYTENIRLVSTTIFVIFADLKLFNSVILPWAKCKLDLDCAIPQNVKARLKFTQTRSGGFNFSSEMLLTLLLQEYSSVHTRAVYIGNDSFFHDRFISWRQQFALKIDSSPSLPHIQDNVKPFVSCVPLAGPNNQLTMIYKTAVIGRALNSRFLAPPISPHQVPHGRENVSQDANLTMGLETIFSSHFLYKHAYIATPTSAWAALLPSVDFIVFKPIDEEGTKGKTSTCKNKSSCSVTELSKISDRIKRFFKAVGILSQGNESLSVVPCSSESSVMACFNASLNAGRLPMGYWPTYPLIEELTCKTMHQFLLEAPFAIPRLALIDGNWHQRSCMAVQLRVWDLEIKDGMATGYKTKSMAVPEKWLLRLNASILLMQTKYTPLPVQWQNMSVIDIVASLRAAATERGLDLYVMMPYIRIFFDQLTQMKGVKTVMDFHLRGASDLEANLFDMAMGAACAEFVKHPASSISGSIRYMRGGRGIKRQNLTDDKSMLECMPVPQSPSWLRGRMDR